MSFFMLIYHPWQIFNVLFRHLAYTVGVLANADCWLKNFVIFGDRVSSGDVNKLPTNYVFSCPSPHRLNHLFIHLPQLFANAPPWGWRRVSPIFRLIYIAWSIEKVGAHVRPENAAISAEQRHQQNLIYHYLYNTRLVLVSFQSCEVHYLLGNKPPSWTMGHTHTEREKSWQRAYHNCIVVLLKVWDRTEKCNFDDRCSS